MSVAETVLHIAGRQYNLRCRDGEEPHLARLATLIEQKAADAQTLSPGLTEVRTLLFAALFLADELTELRQEVAGRQERLSLDVADDDAAAAIEALAQRIEKLHQRLADQAIDA